MDATVVSLERSSERGTGQIGRKVKTLNIASIHLAIRQWWFKSFQANWTWSCVCGINSIVSAYQETYCYNEW